MSALAGLIQFDPARPIERATMDRLLSVISPYGREAQNSWERGGVLLMRALLRTTPEDRLDRQPVQSPESGRVTLFDGRLDNRQELAERLKIESPRLRLMPDSVLVATALDAWEADAIDRLLGDFALAQWDPATRRLLLARDAVGYRPVFYHQGADFFAFGSLAKVLFAIPQVPRELREDALHDYLCLMPMEPQATLYQSVYRLQPGEYLVLEDGQAKVHRYHRFGRLPVVRLADPREYIDGLREQLDRAVAPRLRALGPVASELSSGFDSSTVTAVAALLLQKTQQRLLAFTAVLPPDRRDGPVPPGFHRDEGSGAQALAARYPNIDHVLVESGGHSPLHRLDALVDLADSPILNPCNANWVQDIYQAVLARDARTLLNGWQGNLTLTYDGRGLLQSLWARGRLIAWWRVFTAMRRHYPKLSRRWFVEFSLAPYVPKALWAKYRGMGFGQNVGSSQDVSDYSAVSKQLQQRLNTDQRARRARFDLLHRGEPKGIRARADTLYRVEFAETCLAMNARGLDPRSPTMDRRLIDYCMQIPEQIYIHGGLPKWPIRELGKQLLPDAIVNSSTKGYQAADWFDSATAARAELRAELANFRQHESIGRYLDLDEMERLLDEWPESGWHRPQVEQRYRNKLLRGFAVGAFVRYVENDNR